jgi:hypothetical protein
VCVYSVFVLSCVQLAALGRIDPLSKESYRVKDQETEKAAKAQQRAVEPYIDKVKENVAVRHEDLYGSGGITLRILNLSTRLRWSA